MQWSFAVLATEVDRGRRLGYLPGEARADLADPSALASEIDARLDASLTDGGSMDRLAGLGLQRTDRDALWLLVCCDVEPALGRLAEALGGSACLSDRLLERVFGADVEELIRGGLAELAMDSRVRAGRGVSASRRIVAHVLDRAPPSRRTEHATPEQRHTLAVHPAARASIGEALAAAHATILLSGPVASGRRSLLLDTLDARGLAAHVLDARRLQRDAAMCSQQLRQAALECRLTGRVPMLCNLDALDADRLAIVANDFAPLVEGNILVTCGVQRPAMQWDRPVVVIEMEQPTHAQRATLWNEALGQGTVEDAERLAAQYPLAPGLIVRAAEAAKARAAGCELEVAHVYAGIRAVLDDRLGAYARRITVTQTWDDIVLPPDQIDSIVELMARVRGRHTVYEQWGFGAKVGKGLGVSALFSGPPGTGKTMVAGLIAKELGLELYQVDMAKVVSKFIGETEKNLAALFDAAEAGHAILLFDEADSLFGKRTDVKSSNDRYANLETNYLLQRLETYTGICLLTSNHESNMDPAFQRRLSLHLRFMLPEADERTAMWEALLPAGAPRAGAFDFAGLGRKFAMSAGYIKNAVLRAAFIAADRSETITMAHLERAARVEYEGMGKLAA